MKKTYLVILAILVIAIAGVVFFYLEKISKPGLSPAPILTITNEDRDNLIRVKTVIAGSIIKSPLTIEGKARGYWFFEASFPVRLFDGDGKEMAVGIAQAQDEWMTTEFVPFRAVLTFRTPTTDHGTLVLEKDNPSGLPEHDDQLAIPIHFDTSHLNGSSTDRPCIATGCSGQICSDEEVITTCEYRAKYACYETARCERQSNGHCDWTETRELMECLLGSHQ